MNIKFEEMVAGLVKPGQQMKDEITPQEFHRLHMAVGICGEAGELIDAIKKEAIYKKQIDLINVIEELGDIEFYLEGLRQSFGVTRDETIAGNIAKLGKRYQDFKFTNEAAINRADKI